MVILEVQPGTACTGHADNLTLSMDVRVVRERDHKMLFERPVAGGVKGLMMQTVDNPRQYEPVWEAWIKPQAEPMYWAVAAALARGNVPQRNRFWYNLRWMMAAKDPARAIGRAPDRLTLAERTALIGKYVAFEFYTPQTLPFRRIEAIGDSVEECVRMLKARGLDPRNFEFSQLSPPF